MISPCMGFPSASEVPAEAKAQKTKGQPNRLWKLLSWGWGGGCKGG